MRILVTGGAGYIGSMLVPLLLEAGHKIDVVDSFLYGVESLGGVLHNSNVNVRRCDVRNIDAYKDLVSKADCIIPLAALVGAPICNFDPVGARQINHQAVSELFNKLGSDQLVLMPTTNSAYGSGDGDNFCDEASPLRPISQYARDKVELEQKLMDLPNAVSFRLATVFGCSPRMRTDLLVNDFVLRAKRDGYVVVYEGHFKRNYIHVLDVARCFAMALETPENFTGEIFNVGLSDANISKLELCQKIKNHVANFYFVEADFGKDIDQRNYIVSNAKIESKGFVPRFSLDDGIRELLVGYEMFRSFPNGNI